MEHGINFNPDEAAISALLNDPAGPVGDLLGELANDGAVRARLLAPVRSGDLWNHSATPTSNARPPGFLKASIHVKRGVSREGKLYGSINAEANPLVYIAYPAKHIRFRNMFMTTALYSIRV